MGEWLSTKWVLASDQSSVSSWLVQPIKELSAAALCAGKGCALIRQPANYFPSRYLPSHSTLLHFDPVPYYTA